jgi:hypothetical protein
VRVEFFTQLFLLNWDNGRRIDYDECLKIQAAPYGAAWDVDNWAMVLHFDAELRGLRGSFYVLPPLGEYFIYRLYAPCVNLCGAD